MRKRIITSLAGGVLLLGSAAMADGSKVDICHRPPGNPANFNIISVAPSAVPAHLAHGDNVVGPEVCGDGIDNDCNGVVDDPNVCGPTSLECNCVLPGDHLFIATACLAGAVDCGSADAPCENLCVRRFGQVNSSSVFICQIEDCGVPE